MITHELVIGYPHALKRSLLFSAPRNVGSGVRGACSARGVDGGRPPPGLAQLAGLRDRSGQRDQVGQLLTPRVLDPIGKQHDPFRAERVDGALVVRDQNDRPLEAA